MVEPLAHGFSALLHRHVSSSAKRASGSRRPSLAANFFIPAPRSDKGKAKEVDLLPLDEVLGCQSWATPSSKKQAWAQGGIMRSMLLGELSDTAPSTTAFRPRRTSRVSRKRFHPSIPTSSSRTKHGIQIHSLYSTNSSAKEEVYSPFVPTHYAKHRPNVPLSPFQDFLSHLKFKAQSQGNLEALHQSFKRAHDARAFKALSTNDAFNLLNRFAEHVDSVCLHSISSEPVSKLAMRLQQLYSSFSVPVVRKMKASDKWDYFICRLLSFQGNFELATPLIKKLAEKAGSDFIIAYDSYLLALSRYRSLSSALDFWSQPELTGRLLFSSKFGNLTSVDKGLKRAVEKITHWKSKSRRRVTSQYLLKMAVLNRNTTAALTIIEQMKKMGVEPYFEHVLAICKFLAADRNLTGAKELFNTVPPTDHQFYSQTKLYIYARLGDPVAALRLLEERKTAGQFRIEDRSNVLVALSIAKQYDEMKKFFDESYPTSADGLRTPKPPLSQYSICLLAHARRGDVESVRSWFMDMDKQGIKPNVQIFTHLLILFKKIGDDRSMMYAYNQMLDSNIRPDPALYTIMLSNFANRNNSKAADFLYLDAIKHGITPDERMTSALMNAHVQSGSWQEAYRIFNHLSSKLGPQKPLLSVYNTMFKAHLLLGAPFKVMTRLFLAIKKLGFQPDTYTYGILMMSVCEAGELAVAMEILQEIKQEQIKKRRTDLLSTQIMTILLSAYLRFKDRANAKRILKEMVTLGLQPTQITYAAIVKAYGTSRTRADLEQAEAFVKKLLKSPTILDQTMSKKQPIVSLYLPLMTVPSENGEVEEVERLYEEFLQGGGRPTIAVYHRLLLTYQRADQVHKALKLWPVIEELATRDNALMGPPAEQSDGKNPENDMLMANIQLPLSIYLDILSKFGMHAEAADTWFRLQRMGFKFDTHNWNHLVVVLIRAGQIERAFEVMDRVLLPNERLNTLNMRRAMLSRKVQGVKADKKPDPLESYVPVPQGNPLWGVKDRIEVATLGRYRMGKLRTAAIDVSKIDKDFVYPMKVLEFIRPTWNDWRPHPVVWRSLSIVWLQLEKNFLPAALEDGGELIHNVAVSDISNRNPEAAQALIAKLKKDYAKTARRVRAFYLWEQERLEKKDFERLYSQH